MSTTPLHTTSALRVDKPTSSEASAVLILEPLDESKTTTVSVGEVIRLAFDSLLANRVRALLTMLGVIIGVASVVALLSLGDGASVAITEQVQSIGTNLLTIIPSTINSISPGSVGSAQNLTLDDAEAIARLKLPIIGPSPRVNGTGQIVAAAADKNASINGVLPVFIAIQSLTMKEGSFIDESQVQGANNVVVLGNTLARDLFGSGEVLGQKVRILDQTFRVIGVLNVYGSSGMGASVDDTAYVPLTVAQEKLFGTRTPDGNNWRVSTITISVKNATDIPQVEQQIKALLRDRHKLSANGKDDDFSVLNQASMLTILSTITGLLTIFVGAVAAISLLVGGIGIMNIMLVSVTERTREIGLRKAVGARSQDILLQFVVEALVLSTTGGIVGLILGSSIPLAVTLMGVLNAPVTASTVFVAVGFAMAVGLFFGIYPARRASQLNPIEALRYE